MKILAVLTLSCTVFGLLFAADENQKAMDLMTGVLKILSPVLAIWELLQ